MQGARRNEQRIQEEREERIRRKRKEDPEFDIAETVRALAEDGHTVASIARATGMTQKQAKYFLPDTTGSKNP